MKNFLLIFFFCIGSWTVAQQESNPFSSSEQNNADNENEAQVMGPGNLPGDGDAEPVPIDDFLPLLAMTAVGIIIYETQKKRNLAS